MSLLPRNATPLMRALEAAGGGEVTRIPVPVATVVDPMTCPAALLPWLAWELAIDNWSPDWSETVRRERIRRALAIHRRKGTIRSVRDVVASFGGAVSLREWWETTPSGVPHTFGLVLSLSGVAGAPPSAEYVDQVIADVTRTKPVRSHFTFTLALDADGAAGVIGAVRPTTFARLTLAA